MSERAVFAIAGAIGVIFFVTQLVLMLITGHTTCAVVDLANC